MLNNLVWLFRDAHNNLKLHYRYIDYLVTELRDPKTLKNTHQYAPLCF